MTTVRRFTCDDLFSFNHINMDVWTETYNLGFYYDYMARWPEYFSILTSPQNHEPMGYMIGKAEGEGKLWHGHVSAVTVAPDYRRLGMAKKLMEKLERISRDIYDTYYVDLFVRKSNDLAISMYEKLGYTTYRRVKGYYSGEEDALDMRKSMPRDEHKEAMVPLGRAITPDELEHWGSS